MCLLVLFLQEINGAKYKNQLKTFSSHLDLRLLLNNTHLYSNCLFLVGHFIGNFLKVHGCMSVRVCVRVWFSVGIVKNQSQEIKEEIPHFAT